MFRPLHLADWQLRARFPEFGAWAADVAFARELATADTKALIPTCHPARRRGLGQAISLAV